MSQYLQTSTENPYGHRPWATRLYTGFEDYAFLKQPQNRIIREDVNMRPEIYRPPEMKAGLGDVTIVGGSGRVLHRARRPGTLGAIMAIGNGGGARSNLVYYRPPFNSAGPIIRGPISSGPILPGPMPVWNPPPPPVKVLNPFYQVCDHAAPPAGCTYLPAASATDPCGVQMSCAPPFQILPPPIVPPVPQPVGSGPGGTIYVLPGDATTPGSPFAPPAPGQLPLPAGAVPVSSSAAAATAATPAVSASSLADWFNAQSWFSGVPNGYIAIGAAAVLYMFSKKKR